ncbi:MAG: hypothetical protein IT331_05165 [Anaerolineae bacterium]|nr:hypothetical protein [Anaerolineae bacterium]
MSDSNTILRPPWLTIARIVWILLALAALGIFVVSFAAQLGAPLPECTTPEAVCNPYELSREDLAVAQTLGIAGPLLILGSHAPGTLAHLVWVVIGVFIFWRKSDDWMAWLLSLMLVLFVFEGMTAPLPLRPLANVLYSLAVVIFLLLPFIFPNGRVVPSRMRWVAVPLAALLAIGTAFAGGNSIDPNAWGPVLIMTMAWLGLAIYAVIYRYRRISNPAQRQQTKWIMIGILGWSITLFPVAGLVFFFPPTQPTLERLLFLLWVQYPLYFLSYVALVVCIAIAVFRYRLWDIDIIIRKTLTYATVVALLAVVYFGSVVLLQQIFATVSGQRSEIITVLSTLAIAALFVPLRARVQQAVDRRFYRKKYDAQKVMERFSQTVRDETDLEKLTGELVQVVQETMQPKSASVWLRGDGGRRRKTKDE